MLEDAVAEAVPNDVRRRAAGRQRRGRPELAGLFVADVEGLAGEVAHRIVVPGGEPEFVRVLAPGVGAAAFRNDGAERRIGQHIDPGRGRDLAG